MAGGFKRGDFRGGGSNTLRRSYTKKRSPEDATEAPRANKRLKSEDNNQEEEDTPVVPELQVDEDSNPFVALNHSGKRRVTVSDFKGVTLVSIREYWANDGGELKPGKKGISLSIEQYNALLAAAPLLESVLNKKDLQVARPDYEAEVDTTKAVVDEIDEDSRSAGRAADVEDEG